MGESPPYDDFSLTHGLCARCKGGALAISARQASDLRALGDYFAELRHATRYSLTHATDLLDRGLALGVQPQDLLMGMLQPALYDMGQRWADGLAGIDDEAGLTRLASTVIDLAFARRPELSALRQSDAPVALLAVAPGNAHTLGLRVVEYALVDRGLPVFVLDPREPEPVLLERVRALRPRVVGFSVSMRQQLPPLRSLVEALCAEHARRDEPAPELVAGGGAFRGSGETEAAGLRVLDGPAQLRALAGAAR